MANDSDAPPPDETADDGAGDEQPGDEQPADDGAGDEQPGDEQPADEQPAPPAATDAAAHQAAGSGAPPSPAPPPAPRAPSPPAGEVDVDAIMALVAEAPSHQPPPLPQPGPVTPVPPPMPAELAPPQPDELSSPFCDEPDIPPPHSVPVPMPAPEPTVRPQARVEDITPERGPTLGGTRVTLTGQHLYRVSIVRFGGELAQTIGAREPTEIRVLAPAVAAPGAVDVSVQNPSSDERVIKHGFTYETLPPPKIDSVTPTYAAAAGGTEISVIGKNFVRDTAVHIGDTPVAKVRFVDATTLEVTVHGGRKGALMDVAVVNPDGKRDVQKRAFKYH